MFKLSSFAVLAQFILVAVVAEIDLEPQYDVGDVRILELRVSNTLRCDIVGDDDDDDLKVTWKKDGQDVSELDKEDDTKYDIEDEKLIIRRTVDSDVVPYTCEIKGENGEPIVKEIKTVAKPLVKITASAVTIEGEKLRLECIALGTPEPELSWRFENDTYTSSTDRVTLSENSQKQANGIFIIEAAELSDRGDYFCIASNQATELLNSTVETSTYIRVKDKLAAVWPFMGICAEVIILCSIIFVYERNRSKLELEESDTDGADQKSNAGKDSVRQRK